MRVPFRQAIEERVLLSDAAKGTALMALGLPPGEPPDAWNLSRPEAVESVHREHVAAGSDVVVTNTFRSNRAALDGRPDLVARVADVNRAAARIARAAAGPDRWVGGSMSTTGHLLEPLGDLTFGEARGIFREQAAALAEGGVDFLQIETMGDLLEVKAAVLGIRDATDLPIVALMTFDESLRTLTGSPPEVVAVTLEALGVDVVGANCSLGPEGILRVLAAMREVSDRPLLAQPNAGLPRDEGGRLVYPATPSDFADFVDRYVDLGCRVVGGCCGTTAAHLAAMAERVRARAGRRPAAAPGPRPLRLASRHALVTCGQGPLLIGERINPSGRSKLAAALVAGDMGPVAEAARVQAEAGASVLDLNVGLPDIDEPRAMAQAVQAAMSAAPHVPLSLDSSNLRALEAGLEVIAGRPLLNSVSGERGRLDPVLRLARAHGAAVICLCVDDAGVPQTAEERLVVAERVVRRALELGLRREDLIIDPLTLTVAAEPERARETLRAIRLVKERLGLPCILGVSNVSYGLPGRDVITAAFLAMAVQAGLDAVIANPQSETVMGALDASWLLAGRDPGARRWLERRGGGRGASVEARGDRGTTSEGPGGGPGERRRTLPGGDGGGPVAHEPGAGTAESGFEALGRAVVEGVGEAIVPLVERALESGVEASEVLGRGLIPGMAEVGRRFKDGRFFLPQVLLAAETVHRALARLRPVMAAATGRGPTIVLATVEGDVHDIGKRIVATVLESHGYRVEDLGKSVPAEALVERVAKGGVAAVGLSALMTTTMPRLGEAVTALRAAGSSIPVLVGGAVVTREHAERIGALYCEDALAAVDVLEAVLH